MKKLFVVPLVLCITLMQAACSSGYVTASDTCKGTWVTIFDGRNKMVVSHLKFGDDPAVIDLRGLADGQQAVLVASGYRISDNSPLGTTSFYPQVGGGGGFTAPQQYWAISSFQPGGCQQ